MALGFFENVVVSTKRGSSDEFVEVNVEVTERPTGTFQIGAGFSSRRELHRPGADLAEQPVRPRPDARAAGADQLEPAPAVLAALRRAVLPRHAVDVRVRPLQPEPRLRHVLPQRIRWHADVGLSAAQLRGESRVPHLQARGRQHHDGLRRHREPRRDDARRSTSTSASRTCSAAA